MRQSLWAHSARARLAAVALAASLAAGCEFSTEDADELGDLDAPPEVDSPPESDPIFDIAASAVKVRTVRLGADWRKPSGSTGFHEIPGMSVTVTLGANEGVYLHGRLRIRFPFSQDKSILSAARIQCSPTGDAAFDRNHKSRNLWGGETRALASRYIFYPGVAGTYTCSLSARLDAHNRNTNDTQHRATLERYPAAGDRGTMLSAMWPLANPGVWGTESDPVDADFAGAASFASQTGEKPDARALHIGRSVHGTLPAGTEEFVMDRVFTAAPAATHIRVRIDPELTMCSTTWTGTCARYANHTHRKSEFRYKVRVEQLRANGSVCKPTYWAGGTGFTGDKTRYSGVLRVDRNPHHQPFYFTVPPVPVSKQAGCTRTFRIRTALKSIVGTDPIRLEPGLRNWSVTMVYNLKDGAAF